MLKTKSTVTRETSTKRDHYSKILIERRKEKMDKFVRDLAKRYDTRLTTILKVEDLFKRHIEFDSRSHLARELRGSIKPSALNTIVARLVYDNKVLYNDDHSLTWIDTKGNTKLNKEFEKAIEI
jgi:hypothetical protein